MSGVESLISIHQKEMSFLREEARSARKSRRGAAREMDQAYRDFRARIAAETPLGSDCSSMFRGTLAFMITLLGVLSF